MIIDNLNPSKNKKKYNKELLMLLNEADHITLDDLEFDNILKEQSKILCNINEILNFENNKGKNGKLNVNPVCDISNLNKDSKFTKILSKITENTNTNNNIIKITKKKSKQFSKNKSKSLKKNSNNISNNSKIIYKLSKKTKQNSKQNSIQKSKKKYKKITKKKLCKKNSKYRPFAINNLTSKKKYVYRHNNKRKYDITITKPNIFIKQGKN